MSFQGLLNQTVVIYNRGGFDRYGKGTFTTGASYPARVQPIKKDVLQPDGELVNLNLKVFLKGDVVVTNDDKLVYGGDSYKVITRREGTLGNGTIHHLTLWLTGWTI